MPLDSEAAIKIERATRPGQQSPTTPPTGSLRPLGTVKAGAFVLGTLLLHPRPRQCCDRRHTAVQIKMLWKSPVTSAKASYPSLGTVGTGGPTTVPGRGAVGAT
jgi:hypothetical protein